MSETSDFLRESIMALAGERNDQAAIDVVLRRGALEMGARSTLLESALRRLLVDLIDEELREVSLHEETARRQLAMAAEKRARLDAIRARAVGAQDVPGQAAAPPTD